MSVATPERVIRSYLDDHEGHAQVPYRQLLQTWSFTPADDVDPNAIERALATAGIAVEPGPAQLSADDLITLVVADPPTVASPPPAPPVEPPAAPRRWRPWKLAAAAVAAGLVAGAGVVGYMTLTDDSEERAASALKTGRADVAGVAGMLGRAALMEDVRAAGRRAERAAGRIEKRLRDVKAIEDAELRKPVVEALGAELAALTAIAGVADAGEPRTAAWEPVDKEARRSALALETAAPDIRKLELEGYQGLPGQSMLAGVEDAGRVITSGERKLRRWRRATARVRRQKRGDLAVISSYGTSMRGYLARWNGLRTDLDEWIQDVDANGATFDDAYEFLGTASSQRSNVRQGIQALDAPSAVASSHSRLLAAIGTAITAVDSASEGIFEYQVDFEGEYTDYKDTPSWESFRAESSRVSSEYTSASSALEGLIASERRKIEQRDLPKKPKV